MKKNRRVPDGYGYGYETNIYPAGRVWGNYYPYPTRPIDIPKNVYLTIIIIKTIIIIIITIITIIIIIVLNNNNNSNIIIEIIIINNNDNNIYSW